MSAANKNKCKKCGKIINDKIKIVTYKQKLGQKYINIVEMYCEKCFIIVNKERALRNGTDGQTKPCKRKNKNGSRV